MVSLQKNWMCIRHTNFVVTRFWISKHFISLRTSGHVIGIWFPPTRVAAFLKCCSISETECPHSSFNLVSCSTYAIKLSLGTGTDNVVVGLLAQVQSDWVKSDPSFSHTWEWISFVPKSDIALKLCGVEVVNNRLTWCSIVRVLYLEYRTHSQNYQNLTLVKMCDIKTKQD